MSTFFLYYCTYISCKLIYTFPQFRMIIYTNDEDLFLYVINYYY